MTTMETKLKVVVVGLPKQCAHAHLCNYIWQLSISIAQVRSLQYVFILVLKGIIEYLDYSFAMVIFKCFKSNEIFLFLLKPHT